MEQLTIDYGAEPAAPAPGLSLTAEQREAVARRHEPLLLSAAAGSGKTSVLVERFVQAVCADGVSPAAVLAITFTDRAAAELRERVRARLLEIGERGAARDTEAASVGTFHAFCGRLLRSHPLPAGLDPDFRVLDATASARLRLLAYEEALVDFVATGAPAVDLLAAYGVDLVRATIEAVYAQQRSRGELRPRLPLREPRTEEEAEALRTVALYDELLVGFGEAYERLKRREDGVDFDDLELLAGSLLGSAEPLRESWAERFELLMVDEFQDTNPRQLAILEALDRGNLFTVGDELQAIYGFRHADVRLFRRRRELLAPGGALELRSNFRSRPEVIAAVNTVFADRFADFGGLVHGRHEESAAPACGPFVELLVSSPSEEWRGHEAARAIAAGLPDAPPGRQAEARLLAQRVRELIDAGEARPGEVAVLLRATGDIETFERALQLQGLRTLASVGTFWRRQQIEDLHSYLRALANPRDEEGLYSTLASPLVGITRDGLALIAAAVRESGGSTLWETLRALSGGGGEDLPGRDGELLAAFVEWFAGERARAGGCAISELLERVLALTGYERYLHGLDWAERRLANVHKLLRQARRFEEQEGRDLRGFVDLVTALKAGGAKEPEAPVADVEPDTVQLMTIHTAKGLEFPVVCVADLGRRPPNPADRLFVDGERIGLRLRRPGEGESHKSLDYEELRAEQREREREEENRVFYVGLTRARERLLLSGVADFASWPEEKRGTPPINWLGPALCPGLPELAREGAGIHELPAGGDGPAVRVTLSSPAAYGSILREPPGPGGGVTAETGPAPVEAGGAVAVPSPTGAGREGRAERVTLLSATLSYTSLSLLERCGYRYYLERVLRMPEERRAAPMVAREGLAARDRGTLVHRLLETSDLASLQPPDAARVEAVADELGMSASPEECGQIAALLAGAMTAPLAARIAASPRRRLEHPFAFGLGEGAPLVTGVIDALCEEADGTALVVDYKSDRIAAGTDPETLVARDYAVQRLLYALALLREGALVVEVAHWFLELPEQPAVARYTIAERETLESELAARLQADWADPFAVSRRPHIGLCETCPGRGGLCSWSEAETDRPDPDEPSREGA